MNTKLFEKLTKPQVNNLLKGLIFQEEPGVNTEIMFTIPRAKIRMAGNIAL